MELSYTLSCFYSPPTDHQVRRRKKKSGLRRCDFTEGWVEFRDKRVAKKVAASLHNTPMGTKKRQKYYSDLWSMKVPTSALANANAGCFQLIFEAFVFTCPQYLHRFQWTHLSERLAYEQTVLQQRLRTEVSQAKRETNFYLNNVDKSAHLEKLRKRRKDDGQQVKPSPQAASPGAGGVVEAEKGFCVSLQAEERTWDFTQRQTEEEIQMRKRRRKSSMAQKQLEKTRLIQQKSQSNVALLAKIFNS